MLNRRAEPQIQALPPAACAALTDSPTALSLSFRFWKMGIRFLPVHVTELEHKGPPGKHSVFYKVLQKHEGP